MKQFRSFLQKELYHIFRDVRTIMILLVMPVIQMILFGYAISTEVKNAKIAVYDPSKDIATRRIIEQMDNSKSFDVVEYIVNPNEIEKLFLEGKVKMVMVFGENFNENLLHGNKTQLQLITDATDANFATSISNYASGIIANYQMELMQQNKIPITIQPEIRLLYNPQMKGAYNFVPGVLGLILMLICAMMTSMAIVREKELGTMEVLLVSPMKPLLIIIAKAVPYFLLSCINLATVLFLSYFVLNVPIAGSLFWLIVVSMLFIFLSLSLGLLVSTLVDTQIAAMLISGMVFMMPVMLLSGMMFPIENMPVFLQIISHIIPARWYISAVKDLMIKGLGFSAVVEEISVMLLMIGVILSISLIKFKVRLE